jgi:hypothetical protein
MAFWPFPSGYPAALDNFSVSQIDGVDIVWANHPNSLASAVMALQAKLNVDNAQVQRTGGLAFDLVGHIANPAPPGVPSLWIDTTTAPGFAIMYTDELGNNYDLRYAASSGFIGYGFTCPLGMIAGQLASINGLNSVTYADATLGLEASGLVVNVYGGGTMCDIAYRAEVSGFVGLVPGSAYYLGDAGAFVIEAAIPLTATVKQMIGIARSAFTLVMNPTLATRV